MRLSYFRNLVKKKGVAEMNATISEYFLPKRRYFFLFVAFMFSLFIGRNSWRKNKTFLVEELS